ncbi:MAG TPA: DinB family protein [Methylomirabilota bacterium]|nr:DinB family protein [Methylomirabilota bacterium]
MTPGEVADLLGSSGQAFASTLNAIPPGVASWHPAPGEWCVNEVVGHVIVTDKNGFAGRIRVILGGDEPDLPKYDRDGLQKTRDDCARDPKALAHEMLEVRGQSLELIRSLGPEQLQRGGLHPDVGRLTVDDLLHEWVHHDGNHLRQALANVQAYVWPNMGNARRFSRPEQ